MGATTAHSGIPNMLLSKSMSRSWELSKEQLACPVTFSEVQPSRKRPVFSLTQLPTLSSSMETLASALGCVFGITNFGSYIAISKKDGRGKLVQWDLAIFALP